MAENKFAARNQSGQAAGRSDLRSRMVIRNNARGYQTKQARSPLLADSESLYKYMSEVFESKG